MSLARVQSLSESLGLQRRIMELFQDPIYFSPNEPASTLRKAWKPLFIFRSFLSHQMEMSWAYFHLHSSFPWNAWELLCKHPSLGFDPLRRLQAMVATYIELSSLDYAAPPGFLNLLALSSTNALSALFHAESTLEVSLSGGSPFQKPPQLTLRSAPRAKWANMSHSMLLGILQLKDPFFTKWFYPFFVSCSPLSLLPLRGFSPLSLDITEKWHLLSWAYSNTETINVIVALQSFKELKG